MSGSQECKSGDEERAATQPDGERAVDELHPQTNGANSLTRDHGHVVFVDYPLLSPVFRLPRRGAAPSFPLLASLLITTTTTTTSSGTRRNVVWSQTHRPHRAHSLPESAPSPSLPTEAPVHSHTSNTIRGSNMGQSSRPIGASTPGSRLRGWNAPRYKCFSRAVGYR